MKRIVLAIAALCFVPAPAHAQIVEQPAPVALPCPGRSIIQQVEYPTVPLARQGFQTWAQQTQMQIEGCVNDGTISRDYGYYLELKVMGRVVRYVCLIGDRYEKRQALAQFDETVIEARPLLLTASFESRVNELRDQVHSNCQTGGL